MDRSALFWQHPAPKRSDPLGEVFLHGSRVVWRAGAERTGGRASDRDPAGISAHLVLPWSVLTTEPPAHRNMFCRWGSSTTLGHCPGCRCSCWLGLCRATIRPPWQPSAVLHTRLTRSCYSRLAGPAAVLAAAVAGAGTAAAAVIVLKSLFGLWDPF